VSTLSAARTPSFALRFVAGEHKGGEFPLRPNREIVIGRGSEFDMVLDEDMVSRRHARLSTFHGQIVLQDLKSTNGTFVNGERITVSR
jgi:pSer/pThr/pTyr-binding forkhead associated (FHA) protein